MTAKRFTVEEKRSCGFCKHCQIDGMFGMWCDKGRNWKNTDATYCSDYERRFRMTEKRFVYDEFVKCIIDRQGDIHFKTDDNLVELLNELHEENIRLNTKMKEVYDYFMDYLTEIREDIDYDSYKELLLNINKLKKMEKDIL